MSDYKTLPIGSVFQHKAMKRLRSLQKGLTIPFQYELGKEGNH